MRAREQTRATVTAYATATAAARDPQTVPNSPDQSPSPAPPRAAERAYAPRIRGRIPQTGAHRAIVAAIFRPPSAATLPRRPSSAALTARALAMPASQPPRSRNTPSASASAVGERLARSGRCGTTAPQNAAIRPTTMAHMGGSASTAGSTTARVAFKMSATTLSDSRASSYVRALLPAATLRRERIRVAHPRRHRLRHMVAAGRGSRRRA